MSRPRVLLADDHRILREAFAKLLEPLCEIVGQAADGHALIAAVNELNPDIVVLDVGMPLLNGLGAARILQQTKPAVKLIFLTVSEDPDIAAEAFRFGASAFLLKNSAASELLLAIEEVMQDRTYITPLTAKGMTNSVAEARERRKSEDRTSPRQREVLQLLAEGYLMKEVARILKITSRTVAFHKYAIMKEHGIRSSAELVHFALKHHVISK